VICLYQIATSDTDVMQAMHSIALLVMTVAASIELGKDCAENHRSPIQLAAGQYESEN
jgi:hypothetical protein